MVELSAAEGTAAIELVTSTQTDAAYVKVVFHATDCSHKRTTKSEYYYPHNSS